MSYRTVTIFGVILAASLLWCSYRAHRPPVDSIQDVTKEPSTLPTPEGVPNGVSVPASYYIDVFDDEGWSGVLQLIEYESGLVETPPYCYLKVLVEDTVRVK